MRGTQKKYMLFAVIALLWTFPYVASAQLAVIREYPYLHKSSRAMGMGGANVAVGGRVDSVFYNPAGLITIPQDKGWEVGLINLSAEVGKNVRTFIDDMQTATDTPDLNGDGQTDDDQIQAVNDVIAKYRGENQHVRISEFTSAGKSYDRWAFGMGGLVTGKMDVMPHQGFGSEGLLEVNADGYYGGVGGVSFGVSDNVFVGVGLKYFHRETLIHNFTAREIVENQEDLNDYLQQQLRKTGNAFGADLGVLWKFAPDSALKPALGVSVMNLGDLKFGDAGKIPQSVNLGVSINPSIPWSRSLLVAFDYVDALNNYKQDKDMMKRTRIGAELQVFDFWPAELALRAGLYENSPTYGFDLRLLFITASYVYYSEELGAYAGQDRDKRQMVTLNIGW